MWPISTTNKPKQYLNLYSDNIMINETIKRLDACCLMGDDEKAKIEIIYTGLDKQYEKFVDSLKAQASENNITIKIIRFDYLF